MKRIFRVDILLIVVAAGKLPTDVPPNFGYVVDAAQKKAQERLTKVVPNENTLPTRIAVTKYIKEQPQLVIDAIHEVVEAVRAGRQQVMR